MLCTIKLGWPNPHTLLANQEPRNAYADFKKKKNRRRVIYYDVFYTRLQVIC